jgi:hypothetical protein
MLCLPCMCFSMFKYGDGPSACLSCVFHVQGRCRTRLKCCCACTTRCELIHFIAVALHDQLYPNLPACWLGAAIARAALRCLMLSSSCICPRDR